jgi:hypothetical protein
MAQGTKVNGRIIKPMVEVSLYMLMVIHLMGNGWMIKLTGTAFIYMLMGQFTKVIGERIFRMVMVLKHGN